MQAHHRLRAATHLNKIIEASNSEGAKQKETKTEKNKRRKRKDVADGVMATDKLRSGEEC